MVGLDGDDTLWRNEEYFADTQEFFRALVAPYADGVDLDTSLAENERRNLELFGFGVKGFTLSMIETAIEVSEGQVGAAEVQALLDRGKAMLAQPVELLDGVADTVAELAPHYRLVLITKGDLLHQEQKLARSGLAELFWHIEIISEKDEPTYERILERHDIRPGPLRDGGQLGPLRHPARARHRRSGGAHPGRPRLGLRARRPRRQRADAALDPRPARLAGRHGGDRRLSRTVRRYFPVRRSTTGAKASATRSATVTYEMP